MIALAAFAAVLAISALGMVVLPLVRPVPSAWLDAQASLWFEGKSSQPGEQASSTLTLDAAEDLRTGKLDRRDYALLLEDEPAGREERP